MPKNNHDLSHLNHNTYICESTHICGGDNMANITLSVPDDIHKDMRHFSEIKWSQVARNAIIDKLETLRIAEKLAKKSKITKKDITDFSKKIKSSATKRFLT